MSSFYCCHLDVIFAYLSNPKLCTSLSLRHNVITGVRDKDISALYSCAWNIDRVPEGFNLITVKPVYFVAINFAFLLCGHFCSCLISHFYRRKRMLWLTKKHNYLRPLNLAIFRNSRNILFLQYCVRRSVLMLFQLLWWLIKFF